MRWLPAPAPLVNFQKVLPFVSARVLHLEGGPVCVSPQSFILQLAIRQRG